MYRPKVYTASKLWHAPMWRSLRANNPQIEFTARWIEHEEEMERNAGPAEFGHYWTMDIQDVQRSDFCLCYFGSWEGKPDELKGALVEAGAMLGCGGIVLAVNAPTTHSWSYHPRVVRLLGLSSVFGFLSRYCIQEIK